MAFLKEDLDVLVHVCCEVYGEVEYSHERLHAIVKQRINKYMQELKAEA